jgi:PhzF family phenazine biosynthesis protein
MEIALYQVDAFADRLFAGNPAAVCPLDDWLPDETLQAIAAENNLSETAYLVDRGDAWDLRWFTPAAEVELCGHATLASAFVAATYLRPGATEMAFDTRSGRLTVTREGDLFAMDFPVAPCRPLGDGELAAVGEALGARPTALSDSMLWMAVFDSEASVAALAPDTGKLEGLPPIGVVATAPGDDGIDFVSRVFAPKMGIDEDPVTGAAHTVTGPYWAERLGKRRLEARQISPRGGALSLQLRGERIVIAGQVVPYLEGRIFV